VRRATPERLTAIEPLLEQLRAFDGLTERKPGTFYRRSNAFLHFHEHGERDMYADVKLHGREFERMRVTTKAEQRTLVAAVRRALAPK
jgi:hypothetical protein